MPEAVKQDTSEVVAPPQITNQEAPCAAKEESAEVKPAEASSGTLPINDDKIESNECDSVGATAPQLITPVPEEGKSEDKNEHPSTENKDTPEGSEEKIKETIAALKREGKEAVLNKDLYVAAEAFSKACEKSSALYGELDAECAECYFLYGSVMFECGKMENTVLEEKEESEDDDDEEEEDGTNTEQEIKENGEGEVKVNEKEDETGVKTNGHITDKDSEKSTEERKSLADSTEMVESTPGTSYDREVNDEGESTAENGEEAEDDSSLKVAWEMLELAKVIFERTKNEKRLADTLFRLGEVGIELGHSTAIDDMKKCLEIREKLYPGTRCLAETHFNIGLACSLFDLSDDAIKYLETSRTILTERMKTLSNENTNTAATEIKEIESLLPDLNEKIQDMIESKNEKSSQDTENTQGVNSKNVIPSCSGEKPTSNISHLVKRKRKLDEVASDLQPDKPFKLLRSDCLLPKGIVSEQKTVNLDHAPKLSVPDKSSSEKLEENNIEPMEVENTLSDEKSKVVVPKSPLKQKLCSEEKEVQPQTPTVEGSIATNLALSAEKEALIAMEEESPVASVDNKTCVGKVKAPSVLIKEQLTIEKGENGEEPILKEPHDSTVSSAQLEKVAAEVQNADCTTNKTEIERYIPNKDEGIADKCQGTIETEMKPHLENDEKAEEQMETEAKN